HYNRHSFPTRRSSDLKRYNTSFYNSILPCKENLSHVEKDKIHWWQLQLMLNKLNDKSSIIEQKLSTVNNYWEEVFTQQLFKNFRSEEHTSELQSRENL